MQKLIEEANEKCTLERKQCETLRAQHLVMIGNVLHPSVPISDNEVRSHDESHGRSSHDKSQSCMVIVT